MLTAGETVWILEVVEALLMTIFCSCAQFCCKLKDNLKNKSLGKKPEISKCNYTNKLLLSTVNLCSEMCEESKDTVVSYCTNLRDEF